MPQDLLDIVPSDFGSLFVDEIHRWNKAQQDALLPHVEAGTITLVGATTENPFFYLIGPLLSRSRVFKLEPLTQEDIRSILHQAIHDSERGLGSMKLNVTDAALDHWADIASGDARSALNALELAAATTPPDADGTITIDVDVAAESIQRRVLNYDRDADEHYKTISAFIKSIRGSDPDAALYWLAKMLHAGEDARFIARRLVISASEDIGLADSRGLLVAEAAHRAVEFIGLPEGRIVLAHATVYLATAPKSNRALAALAAAETDVREGRTLAVPVHLR